MPNGADSELGQLTPRRGADAAPDASAGTARVLLIEDDAMVFSNPANERIDPVAVAS